MGAGPHLPHRTIHTPRAHTTGPHLPRPAPVPAGGAHGPGGTPGPAPGGEGPRGERGGANAAPLPWEAGPPLGLGLGLGLEGGMGRETRRPPRSRATRESACASSGADRGRAERPDA